MALQLPRTAQPPPPPSLAAAAASVAPSAPGTHALAYSVTTLMAAELKRLLADKRRQRKAELEARLAAERRALAERRSFDLSVRGDPVLLCCTASVYDTVPTRASSPGAAVSVHLSVTSDMEMKQSSGSACSIWAS